MKHHLSPEPNSWAAVATYLWVLFLAVWGYVADFTHRYARGCIRPPAWLTFLFDLPGAIFFGVITYFISHTAHLDEWTSAALIGLAGHIGGRGVYRLEAYLWAKLTRHSEYS